MQVCGVQTLSECWLGILLWVQWLENESKLTQKKKGNRYQPQNCEPFNHFSVVGKLCFFYHALPYWHPTTIYHRTCIPSELAPVNMPLEMDGMWQKNILLSIASTIYRELCKANIHKKKNT
jgi:hypothetical protein